MKYTVTKFMIPIGVAVIGIALCAAGIYIGETDDAPGAALIGILLMIGLVTFSANMVRRKM